MKRDRELKEEGSPIHNISNWEENEWQWQSTSTVSLRKLLSQWQCVIQIGKASDDSYVSIIQCILVQCVSDRENISYYLIMCPSHSDPPSDQREEKWPCQEAQKAQCPIIPWLTCLWWREQWEEEKPDLPPNDANPVYRLIPSSEEGEAWVRGRKEGGSLTMTPSIGWPDEEMKEAPREEGSYIIPSQWPSEGGDPASEGNGWGRLYARRRGNPLLWGW